MGRASSAKKVARAARAGGGGASAGRERSLLFPATVTIVVVLGISLVAYARTTVDDAEAQAPGLADHNHQAYGIFICDEPAPNLTDAADPNGTHTHSDGVIHIHPGAAQQVARTGDDVTMQLFLEAAGAGISDDELSLPEQEPPFDQTSYVEGEDQCNGEAAIVQVAFWLSAADTSGDPDIITEGLADITFGELNGAAYTIAFAPEGADIPPPASAPDLNALGAADGGTAPPASTIPGGGGPEATTETDATASDTTEAPTTSTR
jgi:hypothetical protein